MQHRRSAPRITLIDEQTKYYGLNWNVWIVSSLTNQKTSANLGWLLGPDAAAGRGEGRGRWVCSQQTNHATATTFNTAILRGLNSLIKLHFLFLLEHKNILQQRPMCAVNSSHTVNSFKARVHAARRDNFPSSDHTGRMNATHTTHYFDNKHCSPLDGEDPWLQAIRARPKPPELHRASSSCSHMACWSEQNIITVRNYQWDSSDWDYSTFSYDGWTKKCITKPLSIEFL